LLSKAANLPEIQAALKAAKAREVRTIDMAQGQKTSRIVAWTYLSKREQESWRQARWTRTVS
jgi:23S rRNA (adenine1618-N6)-methyltransferase